MNWDEFLKRTEGTDMTNEQQQQDYDATDYSTITWHDPTEEDFKDIRDASKGSGGEYFKFSDGDNIVRVLPPRSKEEPLSAVTYVHYVPLANEPDKKTSVNCARMMAKQRCLVCEYREQLRTTGVEADYQAGEDMYAGFKSAWNIIDRNDPDAGPQIMKLGRKAHDALMTIVEREKKRGYSMTDPLNGFDIIITKQGEGMKTTYTVSPDRTSSPLSDDEYTWKRWIGTQPDLRLQLAIPGEMAVGRILGTVQEAPRVVAPAPAPRAALPPRVAAPAPAPRAAAPAPQRAGQTARAAVPPPAVRPASPPPVAVPRTAPAPRPAAPPPPAARPMRTAEDDAMGE